jgi:hypothetical protein
MASAAMFEAAKGQAEGGMNRLIDAAMERAGEDKAAQRQGGTNEQ